MRHDNQQRRKSGSRETRTRILVVCCGAKTEKQYLEGLRREHPKTPLRIVSSVGSPSQLVEYTRRTWGWNRDDFDEAWCVFDVDEFGDDIGPAIRLAGRARISLAISNPCFEFWLLLHFTDHTAWLKDAAAAMTMLRRHLPGYDKTKLNFACLAPGVGDAINRARTLTDAGSDHRHSPSTTMWRLAVDIIGSGSSKLPSA